jgi:hypothetical protein
MVISRKDAKKARRGGEQTLKYRLKSRDLRIGMMIVDR